MEDVKDYLPNHEKYSDEMKQWFIDAHNNKEIRKIFEEIAVKQEGLLWPFYPNTETNGFELDGLDDNFWKMVEKIPCKARHDGFHLAVMARLGPDWAQIMLDIIALSLVMRYILTGFHPVTCIPIPKGSSSQATSTSKPDELNTRPISVVHDGFGFISAEIGKRMMNAQGRTLDQSKLRIEQSDELPRQLLLKSEAQQ